MGDCSPGNWGIFQIDAESPLCPNEAILLLDFFAAFRTRNDIALILVSRRLLFGGSDMWINPAIDSRLFACIFGDMVLVPPMRGVLQQLVPGAIWSTGN